MAQDVASLWNQTHRFASPLRARVLAYEAARSRGSEQLAHLAAVCKAIEWLEPIRDAADIVGAAGRPPSLQLRQGLGSLLLARKHHAAEDVEDHEDEGGCATAVVVNVDRFFLLPHPCTRLWAALDRRQGRRTRPNDDYSFSSCDCERCGTNMRGTAPTAVLSLCAKCYRYLLHEVLAPSKARDFGSLRYWEQEHLENGGCSEAGEDTSDEWFLSWEELEGPLREVWARHLSFRGGGVVALVPGNGRSVIAEGLARQTTATCSPSSPVPIFGEVVATDAAKGITEAMADRSCSSSSSSSSGRGRCARLRYLQDDIRRSSMASGSVHCILDKGLLDALACSFDDDDSGGGGGGGGDRRQQQQQQQVRDDEEKQRNDGHAPCSPPSMPPRHVGTRDERKAVAEYARLLRRDGLLVLNTGRTRSSALAPFSLETHHGNSQQQQQQQQQKLHCCRRWELLEERRFVAVPRDQQGALCPGTDGDGDDDGDGDGDGQDDCGRGGGHDGATRYVAAADVAVAVEQPWEQPAPWLAPQAASAHAPAAASAVCLLFVLRLHRDDDPRDEPEPRMLP